MSRPAPVSLTISLVLTPFVFRWLHVAYSIQALYLLPLRAYRFKQRKLHYFMFDFCYFSNALNFLFLWVFPSSATLWIACYCLSHGSLAIAIITWRDSMVFHDLDKISALFIHIYPPLTFTAIRYVFPASSIHWPLVTYYLQLAVISTLGPNSDSQPYSKSLT